LSLRSHLRSLLPARVRGGGPAGEVEFVVIEDDGEDFVRATVHGHESHEVSLRLAPPAEWSAACTCPLFRRSGACRHLWAVVREADERRLALARVEVEGTPTYKALDPRREVWQARLGSAAEALSKEAPDPWEGLVRRRPAPGIELLYVLDLDDTRSGRGLVLRPFWRERFKNHRWSRRRAYDPEDEQCPEPAAPLDRRILRSLGAARRSSWTSTAPLSSYGGSGAWWLDDAEIDLLLPLLAESGRAFLHVRGREEEEALHLDDGPPWEFGVLLDRPSTGRARICGYLVRGDERQDLDGPHLILRKWVFSQGLVSGFDPRGAWALASGLLTDGPIEAPAADAQAMTQRLLDLPGHPRLEGETLNVRQDVEPHPHLEVGETEAGPLPCRIRFHYGQSIVGPDDPRGVLAVEGDSAVVRRHWKAEREALGAFLAAGGQHSEGEADGAVAAEDALAVVLRLAEEGWSATFAGRQVRTAPVPTLRVRSGVDWFDLEGSVDFDGVRASLPDLLKAVARGDDALQLADGTLGLLPEKVRREWALLGGMAQQVDGVLRFKNSQGWLLDRLLASREGIDVDEGFARLRAHLSGTDGIEALAEPAGFIGELRPYQRTGLGWFEFLRKVGFGGCLADDMGLGKTVQVLALLQQRKLQEAGLPTLVVVPRSLLFNWREEAGRFTPELVVHEHLGPERADHMEEFRAADIVLTTYGVLRRDALPMQELAFDYVILDEAQTIKNARSHGAKAARLLNARHRLALTGTPVENHLGELWSLFEFLNPGMLGKARAFRTLVTTRGEHTLDAQGRALLGTALRPFFLRRTKAEVLPDLPPKVEQTLWCELEGEQRAHYDGLLDHYRKAIRGGGSGGSFQVLRALLRLRQAACHPALVEPERRNEMSAKLDVLLPHLEELVQSNHKALVFSQFTSHLAVVRAHLETMGINYAYLDGSTRDREAVVRQFREDPQTPLLLMSLKAGGLGLNLVEADYVFLLDPWWNPASEAQAIDRAHRIGRTRAVLAYRLIARNTVEEKVVELQDRKRGLADAVLASGTGQKVGNFSIDELEALFT
jgi:superfamily II DNA or RNA helicase